MSSGEAKECLGYAARDPSGLLSPFTFSRRAVGSEDVSITITHCGICYADVAHTRNLFGHSNYPVVPGHEIVGVVTEIGSSVKKFKVGDRLGVGPYVNSCKHCLQCEDGMEVYCLKGPVLTFDTVDLDGSITRGGYSSYIVVHERYCFTIPESIPSALAAPLLCAGITVYAPMARHGLKNSGKSMGVIGLGGLGHMAVKFGKAFGLHVTVFSTSKSKEDEAINILGADKFVVTSEEDQMKALAKSLDFIIDTASGDHPFDPYLALLKVSGVLVLVGAPKEVKFSPMSIFMGMRSVTGSAAGGTRETQEMLEFCAANKIYPQVEVVPIQYANEALERVVKRDVKYRFVIDIEKSLT